MYAYVEVQGQSQGLFFRVHPGWYLRLDSHWSGTNQAGLAQLASKPQGCLHLSGIASMHHQAWLFEMWSLGNEHRSLCFQAKLFAS